MFVVKKQSTGNYYNRDGTVTLDLEDADVYDSFADVLQSFGQQAIDSEALTDADQLVRVTVTITEDEVIE